MKEIGASNGEKLATEEAEGVSSVGSAASKGLGNGMGEEEGDGGNDGRASSGLWRSGPDAGRSYLWP
jgi:hypothetical protein